MADVMEELIGQTIKVVNLFSDDYSSTVILQMESGDIFSFDCQGDEFYEEDVPPICISKARVLT